MSEAKVLLCLLNSWSPANFVLTNARVNDSLGALTLVINFDQLVVIDKCRVGNCLYLNLNVIAYLQYRGLF